MNNPFYLPDSKNQEYNPFNKDGIHTKRVWCWFCNGSGGYRARSHPELRDMDPRITIKLCQHCKGRKKIWITPGGKMDKEAKQIVPSLWPNKDYKIHRK